MFYSDLNYIDMKQKATWWFERLPPSCFFIAVILKMIFKPIYDEEHE